MNWGHKEGRRVLVVEDDRDVRELLVEALAAEGYEVSSAIDGADALAKLDRKPTDLIVLDLMMPGMDGFAFRERQRERSEIAGIPVVVLSAIPGDPRVSGLAPKAVVPKPFSIGRLIETVDQVVEAS